jgi:hypothetical protein
MTEENSENHKKFQLMMERFYDKLILSIGIKESQKDKFLKFLRDNDENSRNAQLIFQRADGVDFFLLVQNQGETYHLMLDPDQGYSPKKKAFFFFKLFPEPLSAENIDRLCYMDLNRDPLLALHGLINDVYLPFMDILDRAAGVSELVTKDFVEKLNDYIAGVYMVLGRIKS